MKRTDLNPGAIVEVSYPGETRIEYAVIAARPAGHIPPNDTETFVWVRYDNGCVVPIREPQIGVLTPDWIVTQLNKVARQS